MEEVKTEPRGWVERPVIAALLRLIIFLLPLVAAVAFISVANRVVARPDGLVPTIVWFVVLTASVMAIVHVGDRILRHLLPIVALFRLSLVFPDRAPSRFKMAMRQNTVRQLQRSVADGTLDHKTPQEAAEHLLLLAARLNSHDRLTRGHTERVRAYSLMIGEEMGLPEDELAKLHWAGLIHDVGKLSVPVEILCKDGKPTDEEWEILRSHPAMGGHLVEPLREWLGPWADAASQHHERWDGNGYPHGLAAHDISLSGRIVAVADAYDVITSARSYKPPHSAEFGRKELANNAGTQFDPNVVRAFLSIGLGRLRLVMGPMSWLTQLPVLGQTPIAPAIGTAAASTVAVAAAAVSGLIAPAVEEPPAAPAGVEFIAEAPTYEVPDIRMATAEDAAVSLDLATFLDHPDSIRLVSQPESGALTLDADQTLTYMPAPDAVGEADALVEVCHDRRCVVVTVTIDVDGVNDTPLALADTATTDEDTPISIDVLANDTDVDSATLSITSVERVGGFQGDDATDVDGRIRYTPAPDAFGTVLLDYTVADGDGGSTTGRVTVVVRPVNDAPRARADGATTPYLMRATVPVLANDSDIDGNSLRVVSVSDVIGGTASHDGATVSFTPASGFEGDATFRYTIDDGAGGRDTAVVTVVVGAAPIRMDAFPDTATTAEDASILIDVTANDIAPSSGPDLTSLAVTIAPPSGVATVENGKVRFTPAPNAHGTVAFQYEICDRAGWCDRAGTTVAVIAVDDPPSFTRGADRTVSEDAGPVAVPGWATAIAPGPPDEAAQTVTFTVTNDNPGLFSSAPAIDPTGRLTFTPAPDKNGAATITITATDSGGISSSPTGATITVAAVNDAPSFTHGSGVTVTEDSGPVSRPAWATAISPGPTDEATQTVTFGVTSDNAALFATAPAVDATGTLAFTPASDANGTATVTVTATDSGGASKAPVTTTITVTAVNDAPTFTGGPDLSANEDTGITSMTGWASAISPGPADEATQSVTFEVTSDNPGLFDLGPTINSTGTINFRPAPDTNGAATITVTAVDTGGTSNGGSDTSAPRSAVITIDNTNDPPVAVDDGATIAEDTSLASINVLTNDTDLELDSLSVSAFDASTIADGTLVDLGGGAFSYTPDANFFGSETFTYTVADGNGGSDDGTVTFQVTAEPDAPTATPDAYAGDEDTDLVVAAPGLLGNDYDVDIEAITLDTTPVSPPTDGAVVLATDGSFTYSPDPGFSGRDSFVYRITDVGGTPATATVTLTIDDGIASATYYLDDSGTAADDYDLVTTPPSASTPVFDSDGDDDPGLTVKHSNDGLSETDADKYQHWTLSAGAGTLSLDGPVTLDLWSTAKDFHDDKDVHPYIWLHDCLGASCTLLAATDFYVDDWNGEVEDWVFREIDLGSITHDVLPGHELRLRLMFDREDMWIAMTQDYPSALDLTIANAAPVAVDDAKGSILEDAATVTLDVLGNDLDLNLDVTTVSITSAPTLGTAVPQPDGTIDYTPSADLNGAESFDYQVCDTAGLCDTATVTFTITAVNDAPSFTGGPAGSGAIGAHSYPGWATDISAGPADEAGQTLTFVVTDNTNPLIFLVQPTVDSAGTLSYVIAVPGAATITLELRDDGGGDDTSAPYVF